MAGNTDLHEQGTEQFVPQCGKCPNCATAMWERTGMQIHIYTSTFLIRDENEEPKICSMFIGKLCSDRHF